MTAEATYVRLSVQESGTLYHLMMQAALDAQIDLTVPLSRMHPMERQFCALMAKLGRANDYCMGKGGP